MTEKKKPGRPKGSRTSAEGRDRIAAYQNRPEVKAAHVQRLRKKGWLINPRGQKGIASFVDEEFDQ